MDSTIVLVHGTIRGMGFTARCEMIARKRRLSGHSEPGPRYAYSDCSVLEVSQDLPDGMYTVTTDDGQSVSTTRQYGLWLAGPGYNERGEGPRQAAQQAA